MYVVRKGKQCWRNQYLSFVHGFVTVMFIIIVVFLDILFEMRCANILPLNATFINFLLYLYTPY